MVETSLLNHSNPPTRTNTLQKSRASSAVSDASTIKQSGTLDDDTMEAIFNSITLPDVEFTHKGEEMHVLDNFDSALANESSQSYRSSVSSLASPISPVAGIIAAEVIAHRIVERAVEHAVEDAVERALDDPEHHPVLASLAVMRMEEEAERERERAAELMREIEDKFDENASIATSRRSSVYGGFRNRSMTMDSTVSLAESRYGGFDVHDDEGNYKAEDIDLYHDEVAYQRVKKPKANGINHLVVAAPQRPNAEDLKELEEYSAKLAQAQERIAFLEQQIAEHKAREIRAGLIIAARTHNAVEEVLHHHHHEHVQQDKYASEINEIYEEDVGVSEIARHQLDRATEIGRKGNKIIVIPQMHEVANFNGGVAGIHKFIVGGEQASSVEDKTVLLFGPVGSGKSAVINSMLNYLYDVKRENGFRFVISDSHHATRGLYSYTFNNTVLPFSVTIIDTPGVPDVKGDRTVSTLVKNWFDKELFSAGRFRLDAISIVLRANERRLEWPFIHELAAVKRMFGDDLKTNVLPIITHTEVLPQPIAVRALASANIAFLQYYKVNNGGFLPETPDDMTKLQHNLFYRHGIASMETYFKDLQELIHPLLAVLRTRSAVASLDPATIY